MRANGFAKSLAVRNRLPAATVTVLSGSLQLQSFEKSIEHINFNYALLGKDYSFCAFIVSI